jgi:Zn-dependent protease with chaperone function
VSAAIFFDGKSTRPHAVTLQVADGFLHISGTEVRRVEVLRALKFTVAYAHAPSRVELPGGATLEIANSQAYLELRALCNKAPGLVERIEASAQYALLALVLILCAGAAGYLWGVPLAADLIVEHAPRSLDASIAKGSLQQLENLHIIKPEQPLTPREKRLSQRFAALTAKTDVPYHLQFRSFVGGPNAFALPDGTIVISSEIEGLSDNDDALLFVMGHELGHLRYRHGMKSLARATMTSIIMTWYVGDVSNALALATAGIANLSYSRQAEAQADHFSAHLLHSDGLSTKPAAVLFHAMENYQPPEDDVNMDHASKHNKDGAQGSDRTASAATSGTPEANSSGDTSARRRPGRPMARVHLPTYLSTHPATQDRIKALEEDKD